MDRGVFPEDIAIACSKGGGLAGVFEVLGLGADGGEGEEFVVVAQFTVAVNDDVGVERAAVSQAHVGLDDTIGADFDVLAKFGLW